MGGFFGVASKNDCVEDVFYGTDYQSHLGTMRGGLYILGAEGYHRAIHDITTSQFRSKFEDDIAGWTGTMGIGVISDTDAQPLIVGSKLGKYGIATVAKVANLHEIIARAYARGVHLSEASDGLESPTEVVATLINEGECFSDGIQNAQLKVQGSCSMLLLTKDGIYAARDKLGRTPVVIGKKDGAYAAASESCSFDTLGFEIDRYLGPGEVALITPDRVKTVVEPRDQMQVCSFLWVYYGYPASDYEDINVDIVRERCGAALARKDLGSETKIDMVAGIPDSGTGHAVGYANEAGIPYRRPFVKYTPTWPRSFMPQDQDMRDLVAKMKLIPNKKMIDGKRILFCEDSIVRGTQLQDTVARLIDAGAAEVHMRPACPPLVYACDFLNFSVSKSVLQLASRKGIEALRVDPMDTEKLPLYANPDTPEHAAMVEEIRRILGLTSLKFQRLDDLVAAIGLPKERLCTHCWDGSSYF